MSHPALTATIPRPVDLAQIERELGQLWKDPDSNPETHDTVTRACMSNLIIYCGTAEIAEPVPDEIATIVHYHPARALLLIGETNTAGSQIQANVSAFCSLVEGGRQVCSEHITIAAAGGAARRLPSVTRALLIGDLPTALWWATPQPPPLGGELFQELSAMSDQIIYESQGWLDPVRGVVTTAAWASDDRNPQILADLEWRRLKNWRRLISQALDPAVHPEALESITEVRLEHGPHALPKAWMMVSWLACKLGWKLEGGKVAPGVEIVWKFRAPSGPVRIVVHRLAEGEPKLQRVSVTWRSGSRSTTMNFARLGPGRLAILSTDASAPPRVLVMPSQPRAKLIAKQLPDLGRDSLFRETLQVSRTMAETLLH